MGIEKYQCLQFRQILHKVLNEKCQHNFTQHKKGKYIVLSCYLSGRGKK